MSLALLALSWDAVTIWKYTHPYVIINTDQYIVIIDSKGRVA